MQTLQWTRNGKFETELKLQEYKDRVVFRGDIVKDDSGTYAIFTEHGSSALQMTAAKVMDVIARLPDGDGPAADAASAHTQIKLEDAPRLLKIPESGCPDVMIRLPRHKWPKSWANIEHLVVPLSNEIYMDTHWQDCYGKNNSRKFYWNLDGKKYQIGNVCLFIENKEYSHQCTWMTSKSLERIRKWLPCGRI